MQDADLEASFVFLFSLSIIKVALKNHYIKGSEQYQGQIREKNVTPVAGCRLTIFWFYNNYMFCY